MREIGISIGVATAFHLLDFVTGIIQAVKNDSIQSKKLRDGLFKKIGFYVVYILAAMLDLYGPQIGLDLPFNVLPYIIAYCCLTEIVSIIENVAEINDALIPDKILSLLNLSDKVKFLKGEDKNDGDSSEE